MKSIVAIGALLAIAAFGPAASAHLLTAPGAPGCSYPPCDDTHIDGSFEIGVPGVDPNYFYIHTSVDSDNGHMSIASALSWLEGTRPGSTNILGDVIEENVVLERVTPGPVTVRATLGLVGGGQVVGPADIKLNGSVSFGGCQIYADKDVTASVSTDLDPTGSPCGGELVGSALVVTVTYEGNLPTSPQLRAAIGSESTYVFLGTVFDFQWEGDLRIELFNATATWDTPTFLTQVPEPDADALAAACFAMLALRAGLTAKATRGTPRRGRAATRPA
jgi:hypothetical protein